MRFKSTKNKTAKFKLVILASLISASAVALAATSGPDFSKIRKDLNVMTQVVKGAFKDNDDCKGCDVKITTNYLAEQGAIFTISTYTNRHSYAYSTGDQQTFVIKESTFDRLAPLAELEALESLESLEDLEISVPDIPDLVSSILIDVGASLEEAAENAEYAHGELFDREWKYEWQQSQPHIRISRSERLASRELARDARDLEYKIRDLEIELLHADKGKQRDKIQEEIVDIEKDVAKIEDKRKSLAAKQEADRKKFKNERDAKQAKMNQRQEAVLTKVQDIVLQSFCDYGSTLKHIPRNEKVSVVFTYRKKDRDTIYVLDKSDLSSCDDTDKLKEGALSYLF